MGSIWKRKGKKRLSDLFNHLNDFILLVGLRIFHSFKSSKLTHDSETIKKKKVAVSDCTAGQADVGWPDLKAPFLSHSASPEQKGQILLFFRRVGMSSFMGIRHTTSH